MPILLGIDPGSRITGYALLEYELRPFRLRYVDSGCIRTADPNLSKRLRMIFRELCGLVDQYTPQQVAIEQVFMANNAAAALKLGQARGAAMVAASKNGAEVFEYTARQVKLAVVGYGAAEKKQMQSMMQRLLQLPSLPTSDEADALGIAWCHAHYQRHPLKMIQQG
jgi:crossover junction endodeoxyribonuclease RuvC